MIRGTVGLIRHSNLFALLSGLCLVACASSNYAAVVYHQDQNITGGAALISQGDPAASSTSSFNTAPASPVQSEALGTTVTSLPPPTASGYSASTIEAERPHGIVPQPQMSVASAPPTSLETRPMVIARDAPVPLGREQPYDIVVQPGDTLYSLSRAHGVETKAIVASNHLQAPYALKIGDRLVIPKGGALPASSAPITMATPSPPHVVKPGETLYSIARREGADVRQIALINNIPAPYALRIGQELKMPAKSSSTMVASTSSGPSSAGGPLLHLGESPVAPLSAPPQGDRMAHANTGAKKPFIWPVSGRIISTFGPKDAGRRNDGVNIAAPVGTAVRAARSGEVIYVGNELRGYGNLVLIRHDDGFVSAYAHNSRILVNRGAFVQQGQQIAESGETGSVTEPQVHFEIRKDRKPIDPLGYLPKA